MKLKSKLLKIQKCFSKILCSLEYVVLVKMLLAFSTYSTGYVADITGTTCLTESAVHLWLLLPFLTDFQVLCDLPTLVHLAYPELCYDLLIDIDLY